MKDPRYKLTLLSIVALLAIAAACTREKPAAAAAGLAEPARAKTKPAPAKKPGAAGKIARIVFLDLEKCCACTRERIDKSWKALTDVVGFPPVPDVERIHIDSQADKAAPYKKQRPIMVPPAIYFFDKQQKLVQMLQGEVKSAQIRATLE